MDEQGCGTVYQRCHLPREEEEDWVSSGHAPSIVLSPETVRRMRRSIEEGQVWVKSVSSYLALDGMGTRLETQACFRAIALQHASDVEWNVDTLIFFYPF